MMNGREEITIRINPNTCRVFVEQTNGQGMTTHKEIEPAALYEAVRLNAFADEMQYSGVLPPGCFSIGAGVNGNWELCIVHDRLRADISLYDTQYPNFPLPRLVFGVCLSRTGKAARCRMGVVKDEVLRPETPMYHYPFSNVNGFHLCTGQNSLPIYKSLYKLRSFPDYILRMPNNMDYFRREFNKPKLEYRELLELLKDKEPAYYYDHILIPNGKTVADFVKGENQ